MKGGDKMIEARKELIKAMIAHNEGKKTNDSANAIHKIGHSVAMNQFAEARLINALGDQERAKMLSEAAQKLKEL